MDLPATSAFHESLMNTSMIQEDASSAQKRVTYGGESFPYGISGVAMPDYGYSGNVYNYSRKSFPRKSRVCCYCGKTFTRSTTRRYHEKRCPLLRNAGVVDQNEHSVDNGTNLSLERKFYSLGSQSPASLTNSISPASDSCRGAVDDELAKQPLTSRRRSFDQANLEGVFVKQESSDFLNLYANRNLAPQTRTSESSLFVNSNSAPINASSQLAKFPSQSNSQDKINGEKLAATSSNTVYNQAGNFEPQSNRDSESIGSRVGERAEDENREDSKVNIELYKYETNASGQMDQMLPQMSDISQKNDHLHPITQGSSHPSVLKIERRVPKMMNKHRCGLCGKLFDTQKQLQMHGQLHTKFKPYTCRYCGQRFLKSAMRIRHERSHLGEKPFLCIACGTSFTRNYSLKLHEQRRHGRDPCICAACGKVCETISSLKQHVQKHENYDAYIVKINASRMTRTLANVSSYTPASNTETVIDINNQGISKTEAAPSDEAAVAKSDNAGAGGNSSNGGAGDEEENQVPDDDDDDGTKAKVKCNDCGKEFTRPYLLKYHIKVHAGLKPFECPVCGKRFGYKNNMKSHLKLHAGIKPYQCCVCDAKFTRGSTLRRHARKHGIMASSIWELFSSQAQAYNANNFQKKVVGPLPSLHNAKTNYASQIRVNPDASEANPQNYESHPTESSLPQSVANGGIYLNYKRHSGQHAYHTPLATSAAAAVAAAAVVAATAVQPPTSIGTYSSGSPPLTALNLSMRNKSNIQQQYPSDLLRPGWDLTPITSSSMLHASLENNKMSTPLLLQINNSEMPAKNLSNKYTSKKIIYRDFEAQTNLCECSRTILDNVHANMYGAHLAAFHSIKQESNISYSPTKVSNGTSPVKFDKNVSSFNGETVSSLLSSGRLFVCEHCECYFKEYAMYRIHQKLHAKDESRPYLCPICNEDCHDRIYFSLHISEHIK